jgi:hypothetical protein
VAEEFVPQAAVAQTPGRLVRAREQHTFRNNDVAGSFHNRIFRILQA